MTEAVSVVITCFNLSKYIGECIESVIAQDYSGAIQIIVVDDCSTDDSLEIIRRFAKVEVIELSKNGGVLNATLQGLKRARHDAIFFLDGDDIWHPSKLSRCMEAFDKDVVFVTHDLHIVDRNKRPISSSTRVSQILGSAPSRDHEELIRVCIVQGLDYVWLGSAFGIRRSLSRLDGLFDYSFSRPSIERVYQDWPIAVWAVQAGSGKIRFINEPLFYYRVHGENYSGDTQTKEKLIRNLKKTRETIEFIEGMVSFLGLSGGLIPNFSRSVSKYELALSALQDTRVALIAKAWRLRNAFSCDRDGAKLASRVFLGVIFGPDRAFWFVEKFKLIRARK